MLEVAVAARLGAFRLDAAFTGPSDGVSVLFGPSGAGKSAILASIAGALRPDAGRVALDGEVWSDAGQWTPPEQRGVGWLAQDARLFPHLPVRANLLYGAQRAGSRPELVMLDETVAALGIGDLLHRRTRDLSGGERQRVALGRALLSRPRLLLLDEPLSALDGPRKAAILAFIERLRRRRAVPIVYVTHSLDEALRLADRLVVVEGGRVIAQGPPDAVLTDPAVRRLTGVYASAAASVEAHEPGATRLTGPQGQSWTVPPIDAPPGAAVRVTVAPG